MNRQPTSLVDFMTVVMAVEYPGLIETDRLILATIAVRADWHTGKHGFPGLDRLCLTTSGKDGRKDRRTIQRRLRWLESIRLIECTGYRRGGQGKATEY